VSRPGFASRLLVGSLVTWRLTHLLAEEDGPADVILRLRRRVGESEVGELMDCFNCLSIWVAALVSLAAAEDRRDAVLLWPALSGAACLLESAMPKRESAF
jgi:Protein of unknown function (DUF1360)